MKFNRNFYLNDPFVLADNLLGATLHTKIEDEVVSGKIVELEVYLGTTDKASHAYGGRRTTRTEVMYHSGGIAYVYFIYGMYSLFNIVTGTKGVPHAILIRALEPIAGIDIMKRRRKNDNIFSLTSGPGKLCTALKITRNHNGIDLTGNTIWINSPEKRVTDNKIIMAKRVGIDYAEEYRDKLWRFYIKDNPHVSKQVPAVKLKGNYEKIL